MGFWDLIVDNGLIGGGAKQGSIAADLGAPTTDDMQQRIADAATARQFEQMGTSEAFDPSKDSYLDMLANKAYGDEAWLEKYINALENRDALSRSQDYDKWLRSNQVQLLMKDLEAAGLNPYTALNSIGSSGGSSLYQNQSGYSANSAKIAARNADLRLDTTLLSGLMNMMSGILGLGSSIARAVIIGSTKLK